MKSTIRFLWELPRREYCHRSAVITNTKMLSALCLYQLICRIVLYCEAVYSLKSERSFLLHVIWRACLLVWTIYEYIYFWVTALYQKLISAGTASCVFTNDPNNLFYDQNIAKTDDGYLEFSCRGWNRLKLKAMREGYSKNVDIIYPSAKFWITQ